MSRVTNADRIPSVLVNQTLRQSPKDVTWGVYGGLFQRRPEGGGDVNGGGENLQEPELPGLGDSLGAAAHVELGEDVVYVLFDGACGEDELLRDLPVGEAGGD